MFKKLEKITILTRMKNEDHFKINRLVHTWKEPSTVVEIFSEANNDLIKVDFMLPKSMFSKFKKDLDLLTYVGIYAVLVKES